MKIRIVANTDIPDVSIDFIEIKNKDGNRVNLNWDESEIYRCGDELEVVGRGVYYGEEYANGRLNEIKGFTEINAVQIYSEQDEFKKFVITEISIIDDENEYEVHNPKVNHILYE